MHAKRLVKHVKMKYDTQQTAVNGANATIAQQFNPQQRVKNKRHPTTSIHIGAIEFSHNVRCCAFVRACAYDAVPWPMLSMFVCDVTNPATNYRFTSKLFLMLHGHVTLCVCPLFGRLSIPFTCKSARAYYKPTIAIDKQPPFRVIIIVFVCISVSVSRWFPISADLCETECGRNGDEHKFGAG